MIETKSPFSNSVPATNVTMLIQLKALDKVFTVGLLKALVFATYFA